MKLVIVIIIFIVALFAIGIAMKACWQTFTVGIGG